MRFTYPILMTIAGAVVAQGVSCQADSTPSQAPSGVSMRVKGATGDVGYICEPFLCSPHRFVVLAGETVKVEMFGLAKAPYILFAGTPARGCYTLPWALGAVTMDSPFVIEVGQIPPSDLAGKCGMNWGSTAVQIPDYMLSGSQLVLQTASLPATTNMLAFSRGVTLAAK